MPIHSHRVYLDHDSSSRRARFEGWLILSIVLAAVVLLVSLLGCLLNIMSTPSHLPSEWLQPNGLRPDRAKPVWTELCEILATLSGIYLVIALFIESSIGSYDRSHTR